MSSFVKSWFGDPAKKAGYQFPQMMPIQSAPVEQRNYEAEQAAKDAAEKQRKAANLAKGAASTILTTGAGLTESPSIQRKLLFGH